MQDKNFRYQRALEHATKQRDFLDKLGIKVESGFMGRTKEQWQDLYNKDVNLNFGDLHRYDQLAYGCQQRYKRCTGEAWSLSVGACLYKSAIKRDILGKTAEECAEDSVNQGIREGYIKTS